MKYVIVRTYSAGVFAGQLESRNGREVILRNARRIWYWSGQHHFRNLRRKEQKILKIVNSHARLIELNYLRQ
jgi:hypothetical protein